MNNLPSKPSHAIVGGPNGPLPRAQAPFQVESQPGWGIRDLIGVFRRHLWLISVVTSVTVGIGAWLVGRQVTEYESNAMIRLIDRQSDLNTPMGSNTPIGEKVDPILSEMVVLTGRTVLGEVVDREGLRIFSPSTEAPAGFVANGEVTLPPEEIGVIHLDFTDEGVSYGPPEDRRYARYGEPIRLEGVSFVVPESPGSGGETLRVVPRDRAIDYLQENLTTTPDPSTGGIAVSLTSMEPSIAPRTVNAIVEVYKSTNVEMARESLRRRRSFIEEQLRSTDSLLMVAQEGLSGLRSRTQSYTAAAGFGAEQGNLLQADVTRAQLQADLRMHEDILGRIMQARSSGTDDLAALMSMPGIASDPVVGQLYGQLATYQTEREGMLAGPWARAPTHPDVQRLNTLIASTQENLIQAVRNHVDALRAQIGAVDAVRGRAAGRMNTLSQAEIQEVYLTQNLSALQQMGDQLRDQYQAVRLEEASEIGMVEIVQLSTRALPQPSKARVMLGLALVVGLMLGGGAAFAREMLDDSMSTPKDVEEALLVPNLAVIPAASAYLTDGATNGRKADDIESRGQEAYRVLRTNLLFSRDQLKTLVVTSAAPGEGKTMTSVNLAAAYARQGLKVMLMECDLRRPSLSRYFKDSTDSDIGNDIGSVLFDQRSWREAVHVSQIPGLHVLLAGRAFSQATESLGGEEMKKLLNELSSEYDIVILDSTPLLVAADATILGAIADGVLLVVRASQTDRAAVQQAVHQLELVGARVVGTVLNDPEGSVAKYSHYYDYSAEYEAG
jgi:capsular exopolysaccharide synthesis family protein